MYCYDIENHERAIISHNISIKKNKNQFGDFARKGKRFQ